MPNVLPGVVIKKEDLSNISNVNISLIGAAIGEFEYGDDEEVMNVNSTDDFIAKFGDIDNAPNKQAWIALYIALLDVGQIKVMNVTKNAKYGGLLLTSAGMKKFPAGITTRDKDSFSFYFLIEDEVLETGDGSTVSFDLQTLNPTIYNGYAPVLKFTIGDVDISVTGTQLDNGTVVFTNANITSAILDNITGILTITFDEAPDLLTNITLTYKKGYNDYIVNELLALGDGSSLTFGTITANNLPILNSDCILKYTIGGVDYEQTGVASAGTITFTDAVNLTTATVNQTTGAMVLTFINAPDLNTEVTLSYEQEVYPLAAMIASSKKSWSDDNGLKITVVDATYDIVTIEEYKSISSIDTLKNTYQIGFKQESKNTYGKNIFIEDVFANGSLLFYSIVNTDTEVADMLPVVDTAIVYADGGVDGDTVTDTERAINLDKFLSPEVTFDKWCGAGITSKTLVDVISNIVTEKSIEAYMDTIDGLDTTIKTWMDTTINIDNMNLFFTCPNYYVSYKGTTYVCPVSGLQLKQKARRVKAGQPFMPPVGVGTDRGTLDVVKPVRYFTNTQVQNLHASNINVGRYFRSYGNVLFSDFTAQRKLSSTSYMNSVETLNHMYKTFDNSLLVINFNVINEETFMQLRTIIEGYLKQLEKYEGTINPEGSETGWILEIESLNNNDTRDERKIYARLIFTFQTLAETIDLTLTYTSNQVFKDIAK